MADQKHTGAIKGVADPELSLGKALANADMLIWGKDGISRKRVKPANVETEEAVKALQTALDKDNRQIGS